MRVVGGKLKGRRITPPPKLKARPTTDMAKEALFNVLTNLSPLRDIAVLDLFSGSGGISLEFWSRGAREVIAVDVDPVAKNFLQKTVQDWKIEGIRVVQADIFKMIKNPQRQFDIVFADPPYADPRFLDLPGLIMDGGWLIKGGWFVLEHSDEHDFQFFEHFHSHKVYGSVNFSFFHFEP